MADSETFRSAHARQQIENDLMETLRQRQHEWAIVGEETSDDSRHRFMDARRAFNALVLYGELPGDHDWQPSEVRPPDDQPVAPPRLDREEARLLTILTWCGSRVTTARIALSNATHSMLMAEYMKLVDDLDMARAECTKAMTTLREYRKNMAA